MRKITTIATVMLALLFVRSAWATPVSHYGLACDGNTDDAPAFNAIPCDGSRLEFPPKGDCVMKEPVTLNHPSCHQWSINGASWDFASSGLGYGSWVPLVNQVSGQDGDYGNRAYPMDGVTIIGPGLITLSAGLTLHDNHMVMNNLTIHEVGIALKFGAFSYDDDLNAISFYHAQFPIICGQPGDSADSGEQINFFGGSIFNTTDGIRNEGCEVHLKGTAIDYVTSEAIINTGNASTTMEDGHINVPGLSGYFIDNGSIIDAGNGGCDTLTDVYVRDTRIYATGPVAGLAQNNKQTCEGAGGWIKLTNDIVSGFSPTVGGDNPSQVALCGNSTPEGLNSVPNQGSCP
jgi:hypothetical protein